MKMKVSSLLVLLTLGFEFAICQAKDYYKTLGLSDSASVAEVKKAFRQMAKTLHPDKCKEEGAEARFREILEAYEVLSDEDKKRQYDRHRKGPKTGSNSHNFGGGTRAQDFNFDFSELFRQFEEDIFNAGPNKESKKDHYRSHFGSHFKNHAKQSGGFFEMDDFFHDFDAHFDEGMGSNEEIFGNMDSMFQFEGFDGMMGQRHSRQQSCHTVTQKIGNTMTTYTQCS